MPVQFDKIDADIEIVPSSGGEAQQRAPIAGAAPPARPREDSRRAVSRILQDELDEYLRIRG